MKTRLLSATAKAHPELVFFFAFDGASPDGGPKLNPQIKKAKATGDLSTDFRKVLVFYPEGRATVKRLGFVGMGKRKELTPDRLRRAAAIMQQQAESLGVKSFVVAVNENDYKELDADVVGMALTEGLILGAYRYDFPSGTKRKPRTAQLAELDFHGKAKRAFKSGWGLGVAAANATVFSRDIENLPGNLATPSDLAREARKFNGTGIKVKVLNEADMKRLKMNALLGVSRGSKEPAKLIVMDYNPRGAKQTICVVGKGLTFDSGGISIKPSGKMDEMRYDMCGGGAVLGLFHAIRNGGMKGTKGKVRIVGVVPSSENMPDADAQKPGDVVTACNGTTIEVLNTDAEGRLILADALAYANKTYKPHAMVDLATLTGAVIVALGHEMSGVMGNDDALIDDLLEAGQAVDDPLWQLPLWDVHKEQCRSKFADIANLGSPAHGNGTINGAAFLSHFVDKTKWAHIDIAGAAWGSKPKDYYSFGATGTGVRMLLHWLRQMS